MNGKTVYSQILGLLFLIFAALEGKAQYKVKGTVYDKTRTFPIEAVSVMATNGRGTITDSLGHYQLDVSERDSIWFSYQNKSTPHYAVAKMEDMSRFDVAIMLKMDVLQEVRVRTRNYRQDSIENRREYAKIFDFHRPTVGSMTNIGPTGAGIDLDELIRVFQFKKNKATERLQQRLLEQEREKSVDHRFNKPLVRRLTGLDGPELDKFMQIYRPSFIFTSAAGEYDFQLYIKNAYEDYKKHKTI